VPQPALVVCKSLDSTITQHSTIYPNCSPKARLAVRNCDSHPRPAMDAGKAAQNSARHLVHLQQAQRSARLWPRSGSLSASLPTTIGCQGAAEPTGLAGCYQPHHQNAIVRESPPVHCACLYASAVPLIEGLDGLAPASLTSLSTFTAFAPWSICHLCPFHCC
jgi:hypothetical protein